MEQLDKLPTSEETHGKLDHYEHGELIELTDKDLRNVVVGNRIVLQGKEGELIGYNALYESTFVAGWLHRFAIDRVNETSYFDYAGWSELTDGMTEGMVIVEDGTDLPIFIIPSFSRPLMDPELAAEIAYHSSKASGIKNIQDKYIQDQEIKNYARTLDYVYNKDGGPKTGLTHLVPDFFYEKHGIVPEAVKAMIYIRDVIRTMDNEHPDFDKVEAVFKKHYTGQPVSVSEKQLVFKYTEGMFKFDKNDVGTAETQNKPAEPPQEDLGFFDD